MPLITNFIKDTDENHGVNVKNINVEEIIGLDKKNEVTTFDPRKNVKRSFELQVIVYVTTHI